MEIDIYNLAAMVYDELHKTCRPGDTISRLDYPWECRSEKTRLVWEEAVKRALVRAGIVIGNPAPAGYSFSRERRFRKEKPPEGNAT